VPEQMPRYLVSVVTSRWAGRSMKGVTKTPERQDIARSSTSSRPALGPSKLNSQWVLGVKQPGREDYHSSAFIAEFKFACSYISDPLMPPGLA
jgi:hypothetical protein